MSVTMSMLLNVNIQEKIVAWWPLISGVLIWVSVCSVDIAPRNPGQVIHGWITSKTHHPEIIRDDHYGPLLDLARVTLEEVDITDIQ